MSDDGVISIDAQREPGTVVVSPAGDVDMARSPELRNAIQGVIQQHRPTRLVVNLSDVSYMDSSGLATLVEAMRTTRAADAQMILCGMNDKVRAIFEIARLHQFFTIQTTLDDALSSAS